MWIAPTGSAYGIVLPRYARDTRDGRIEAQRLVDDLLRIPELPDLTEHAAESIALGLLLQKRFDEIQK